MGESGDSTTMTIEFLRARLLSERSVSRTARQRADQLAKRVNELEEQLKIVTIQRKKAERAAAEVLAILESQGTGDFSEAIDSSSDQDEVPCRKGSDDNGKEDEASTTSRVERSEVEDGLSGSEHEVSPSQGKSLSWKSHSNSPDSREKQKTKHIRQRRYSFMSTLKSSPKHHSGTSCRKIKRREMGSETENAIERPAFPDVHENGAATWSNYYDDQTGFSAEDSRSKIDDEFADTSASHSHNDQNGEIKTSPYANGDGRDEEMERVLEQQAQLIGQFEAEENAQRLWEEKYNENKMSTMAYHEPGSQPSIAANSSQPKEEPTEPADSTQHCDEEAKSTADNTFSTEEPTVESVSDSEKSYRSKEATPVAFSSAVVLTDLTTIPNGSSSSAARHGLVGQQFDRMVVNEIGTSSLEFAFPAPNTSGIITNVNQNQAHASSNVNSYSNSNMQPHRQGILENPSTGDRLSIMGPVEIQNQHQTPSSRLGGVLEALQRAKVSLRQEMNRLPAPIQGTLAIEGPASSQVRDITSADTLNIPIGSAGLFRIPTDSFAQTHSSVPRRYGSGLRLAASHPDIGYSVGGAYGSYRYPTAYMEPGSRVSVGNDYFDRSSFGTSLGAPPTARYSLPYSELSAEPVLPRSELSKSYSDVRNGMSSGDRYSLYGGDRTWPDMRRM